MEECPCPALVLVFVADELGGSQTASWAGVPNELRPVYSTAGVYYRQLRRLKLLVGWAGAAFNEQTELLELGQWAPNRGRSVVFLPASPRNRWGVWVFPT